MLYKGRGISMYCTPFVLSKLRRHRDKAAIHTYSLRWMTHGFVAPLLLPFFQLLFFSVVGFMPSPLPGSVCALTFTGLDTIFFRYRIIIFRISKKKLFLL